MTTYYRTSDGALRELTSEQFAGLAPNKQAGLRLWSVDPRPAPGADQVVIDGPIVVDATTARQTWALRAKTQAEQDAEAQEAERQVVVAGIATLTARIQAYNPVLDQSGTVAQQAANMWIHIKEMQLQLRDLNRGMRYELKKDAR